jgi:hypothetical protein
MFKELGESRVIMVVGPQRAGTRICSRMIAADTGHDWVPEEEFNTDSLNRFGLLLNQPRSMAIQAPCMTRYAHMWVRRRPGVHVVLMRRNVDDIVASQQRVNWQWEFTELMRYWPYAPGERAATVKYRYWDSIQKHVMPKDRFTEVEYSELEGHPLWIPKENRTGFTAHQTSPEHF